MRRLAATALAALLFAACGGHDHGGGSATATTDGNAPTATFEIDMTDIAYAPKTLSVPAGRVTFVFHNRGEVVHDAFLGDDAAQKDHEAEMAEGGDAHHHEDPAAVTVEPGGTGRITHVFAPDDRLLIGCHQPGHYAAGMRITINVRD